MTHRVTSLGRLNVYLGTVLRSQTPVSSLSLSMSSLARVLTRTPYTLHAHSRTQLRTLNISLHSLQRSSPKARIPLLATRSVASSVSNKPASQTVSHAYTNAKEESGNSAKDLAKKIAGNVTSAETVLPKNDSFVGFTSAIASDVPRHILTMGLAGALPYLGTSISTIYLARQAGLAASGLATGVDPSIALSLLESCLHLQVTYGAVLISFAGALHWGLEIAGYNGRKGYPRLFLGAAPVVFAWSTLALDPVMALVAQWAGYTGLWFADMKATSAGWTPKWYSQYRFYLSVLVGTCIIGTLAGTSYLGPAPGHDATHRSLDEIRAHRRLNHGDLQSEVKGPIAALPAGEDGDAYVVIRKNEPVGEGEGEAKDEGKGGKDEKRE